MAPVESQLVLHMTAAVPADPLLLAVAVEDHQTDAGALSAPWL
jgi:hypothetical protein